jgi:hypothetical protein
MLTKWAVSYRTPARVISNAPLREANDIRGRSFRVLVQQWGSPEVAKMF